MNVMIFASIEKERIMSLAHIEVYDDITFGSCHELPFPANEADETPQMNAARNSGSLISL